MRRLFGGSLPERKRLCIGLTLITSAALVFIHTQLDLEYYRTFTYLLSGNPVLFHRIQLWFEGKCIGSSPDGRLRIMFCNPREEQYFQLLPDGRLMFGRKNKKKNHKGMKGKCVLLGMGKTRLVLGNCTSAIKFNFVNDSYLQLSREHAEDDEKRCVSPITVSNEGLQPSSSPQNRDPVALSICDEVASRITLIEENSFQESRKYLLLPLPNTEPKCDFPACGMNRELPPVTLLPRERVDKCDALSQCVTIVTTTARRPHLIFRLIDSVRSFEMYRDLPVVAYDDGTEKFSSEIMDKIAKYPNLKYIIGDQGDMGIAQGRNMALQHVNTKYFFLLDDDNLFRDTTDLKLLAQVLDTTDASLVGGKFENYKDSAGLLNFGYNLRMTERRLFVSQGACTTQNKTIPNIPTCINCELTPNVFLARTSDIQLVGGWSEELKVMEHKDLFVRLKGAGKKVVYCPGVKVFMSKQDKETRGEKDWDLRRKRETRMRKLFCNRWNIDR